MLTALAEAFTVRVDCASQSISLFVLAYEIFQQLTGPLGDRLGKARTIALAAFACALCNIGASAAGNLDQLIVARLLSGATAAAIIPLTMVQIGDHRRDEMRQLEVGSKTLLSSPDDVPADERAAKFQECFVNVGTSLEACA